MKVIEAGYEIILKEDGKEILKHLERIGRTCYKSEDRITDDSAEKFVAMLIRNGHTAMIEHFSFSVRFTCDRGVSHEIVRHRLASYGQESTRYCNYSQDKFGNEINVIDISKGIMLDKTMANLPAETIIEIIAEWLAAMEDAQRHYNKMIALGATAQIARDVLPTSTKTEIVVTMDLVEWRHFFRLRTPFDAHPQMRELTRPLLTNIQELIPVVFDDIKLD